MQHRQWAGAVLAALFLLAVAVPQAGAAAYMKFDGIDGESQAKDHHNEIDVLSFQGGVNEAGAGGANQQGGGRNFTITKRLDRASPLLMLAAASGQRIACGVLTLETDGDEPFAYSKYEFKGIIISSYRTGGSSDDVPVDEIGFAFTNIAHDYFRRGPDGRTSETTSAGWDFLRRVPFESSGAC